MEAKAPTIILVFLIFIIDLVTNTWSNQYWIFPMLSFFCITSWQSRISVMHSMTMSLFIILQMAYGQSLAFAWIAAWSIILSTSAIKNVLQETRFVYVISTCVYLLIYNSLSSITTPWTLYSIIANIIIIYGIIKITMHNRWAIA